MRRLHRKTGEGSVVDADHEATMTGVDFVREHLDLAGALDIGLAAIPEGSHLRLHLVQRQEPLIGGALCPLLVSLHQGGHGLVLSECRGRGCPQHPKPRWRAARRARGSDLQVTDSLSDVPMSQGLCHSLQALDDDLCSIAQCPLRGLVGDLSPLAQSGTTAKIRGGRTQQPEHVRVIVHCK
jgi:hypothetical protein